MSIVLRTHLALKIYLKGVFFYILTDDLVSKTISSTYLSSVTTELRPNWETCSLLSRILMTVASELVWSRSKLLCCTTKLLAQPWLMIGWLVEYINSIYLVGQHTRRVTITQRLRTRGWEICKWSSPCVAFSGRQQRQRRRAGYDSAAQPHGSLYCTSTHLYTYLSERVVNTAYPRVKLANLTQTTANTTHSAVVELRR